MVSCDSAISRMVQRGLHDEAVGPCGIARRFRRRLSSEEIAVDPGLSIVTLGISRHRLGLLPGRVRKCGVFANPQRMGVAIEQLRAHHLDGHPP